MLSKKELPGYISKTSSCNLIACFLPHPNPPASLPLMGEGRLILFVPLSSRLLYWCSSVGLPCSGSIIYLDSPASSLIRPITLQHSIFMPTLGRPSRGQRAAHAARHTATILNAAPAAATLHGDRILPLPTALASPLAPHVVAKFTAWLQEDNHPHRALCQEDSEASPRHIKNYARSPLTNRCTLILSIAHPLASHVLPS